jgi:hypothetical protein
MTIENEAIKRWVENRLAGIGSHLRKVQMPHAERKRYGLALTSFMNATGVNKPRVYARFFNQDNSKKPPLVKRTKP